MAFITVSQGGPEIAEGVYPVILSKVEGPKTVTARRGPNAGQEIDLLDWTFVVLEGEYKDTEIQASTSTASGPRSKLYAFLTALFGKTPPVGTRLEVSDLTGRVALATIKKDDEGWPRVANLGAMPASLLAQHVGAATGAPVAAAPVAVTKSASDLPF